MSFKRFTLLASLVLSLVLFGIAETRAEAKKAVAPKKTVADIKKNVPDKTVKKAQAKKAQVKKFKPKPVKKRNIKPASNTIQAKAVYCVNLSNNETIMARNENLKLPIASLTKLVSAMVTLENMPLDKRVKVPDHIKSVPKSVVGLKPGDELTVNDLLHGMLINSGNDCAETLACAFPGGKHKFVSALNKKAIQLGSKKSEFFTPSGLDRKPAGPPDKISEDDIDANASTAKEIANIARIAFQDRTIRSIVQKKSYVMKSSVVKDGYPIRNTNKLLRDNLPVVGGKTGFTVRAGHCLASQFSPDKKDLLIVVLGSPNHFNDTRLVYRKALKDIIERKRASAPRLESVAKN
ncbi:MAG: D-alanyl-D-alanine carboxypeptidase family protein [Desulfomonilaceae bacterium]